jgi:cytochrome P450
MNTDVPSVPCTSLSAQSTGSDSITFTDPDINRCPFPVYDFLRDAAPVYRDPATGHYVVTRYDDVRSIAANFREFSNSVGLVGIRESDAAAEIDAMYARDGWPLRDQMQSLDPPEHKEKRARVERAFARWEVEKAEPLIEALAEELVAGFINEPEVEFVSRFAVTLTVAIISNQLGVVRGDRPLDEYTMQIQRWSDLAVEDINPLLTPERHAEITRELIRMQHFFFANVERAKAHADDTLVSKLIQTVLVDGEPDIPEILEVMKTILVAGNETTRFAMASGMSLLIENPAIAERLADNPDDIPRFVEEALRIRSPVQTLFRRAVEDVELHGVHIPKGARIEVRYGSANRDPSTFECPADIRLDRPNAKAHLAFGVGIHSCIGTRLARAELLIGFRVLLRRLKNFRAARGEDSYSYNSGFLSHGLAHLHLAYDRR